MTADRTSANARLLRRALALYPASYDAAALAELADHAEHRVRTATPLAGLREVADVAGHGARVRFGLVSHRPTGRALATAAPLAAVLAGTYAAVHLWWAVMMVTDPSFQVFWAPGAQRFGPLAAAAALLAPAALMTLAVLLGRWTAARTLAVVTVVTAPLIHLLARPDLLGTVADATVFYGIGTRDSAVLVLNALVLLIAPPDRTTRPGPAVPWVLAVAITASGVVLDLTDGFGNVVHLDSFVLVGPVATGAAVACTARTIRASALTTAVLAVPPLITPGLLGSSTALPVVLRLGVLYGAGFAVAFVAVRLADRLLRRADPQRR
ncbi:hypothetical protein ACFV0O_00970 [Kitasatospora sp. NPDC059577]|uniref:hypothetical protein n=1 Tax=Kitasatospora sp. NPDC059577 TaxID=3346873 RepID=UPI0036ACE6C8